MAEIIVENVVHILNYNLDSWFTISVNLSDYNEFPVNEVMNSLRVFELLEFSRSGMVIFGNATTVVACCKDKNWESNRNEVTIVIRSFFTDEDALEFFHSF